MFNRAGLRYDIVTGYLKDASAWEQIGEWVAAAKVYRGMRENRLGILGHYYGGMLDVYTDITRQSAVFGTHLEMLEMCELKRFREQLTEDDVNAKLGEFRSNFEVSPECEDSELRRAARHRRHWTGWSKTTGSGQWPIITRAKVRMKILRLP